MIGRPTGTALGLALVLLPGALAPQATTQWRYAAAAEVTSLWIAPNAAVIVETSDQIVALDPATGVPAWTRSGVRAAQGAWWFGAAEDTAAGILDLGDRLEAIDLTSGRTRWDTKAAGITAVRGYLAARVRGMLLVHGASAQDSSVLFGVDLMTGQVVWRHPSPFAELKRRKALTGVKEEFGSWLGGEQPAQPVTDTTFLLYISDDGPVLVNANTGEYLWRATTLAGKRPPALRDAYPPMLILDSIVFVPREWKLHALRLSDGSPYWIEAADLPSRVRQLHLTNAGLLVRGTRRSEDALNASFVDLLDPRTGASRWPKQYKRGTSMVNPNSVPAWISPFVVRGERVYFAAKDKLVMIPLAGGKADEIGKVDFDGGEEPTVVESRPGGIFLLSPQNLMLADTTGSVRYRGYYPGPKTGGFLGNLLGWRYGRARHWGDFVSVLTVDRDSTAQPRTCLKKVSKDDNRVLGRIWLNDASWGFAIAPDVAYVMTTPREVTAFRW